MASLKMLLSRSAIPAEYPTRILKKYDHDAYSKSGMSVVTVEYMFGRLSDKMTAERGISAYAVSGGDIPGNVKGLQRFCGIVFTSLTERLVVCLSCVVARIPAQRI